MHRNPAELRTGKLGGFLNDATLLLLLPADVGSLTLPAASISEWRQSSISDGRGASLLGRH